MDTLYESLVRQIASTQITSSQQDLHQAVSRNYCRNRSNKKEMAAIRKKELKRAATAKEICLASKIHAAKKEAGVTYLANGNKVCHHKMIYIKIKFNMKSLQKSIFIFTFV